MAVSLNERFPVETVTIEELIGLGGPFEKEKVAEELVTKRDKVCKESQFLDSKLPKNIRKYSAFKRLSFLVKKMVRT